MSLVVRSSNHSTIVSSHGQSDNINLLELSPEKQHEYFSSKAQASFAQEKLEIPRPMKKEPLPKKVMDNLNLEERSRVSSIVTAGIVALPFISGSTETTYRIVGRSIQEDKASFLSTFGWGGLAVAGVAAVGLGGPYMYIVRSEPYQEFEVRIERETEQMCDLLRDPEIRIGDFVPRAQTLFRLREEQGSYWRWIFDFRKPNSMYHFLIVNGIAYDSNGFYLQSQEVYKDALNLPSLVYRTDRNDVLRNLFQYLYARSLRLSERTGEAREYLEEIPENSPLYELIQLERAILQNQHPNEVFDEEGLPHDFKCPISGDIPNDPVYCEGDNPRRYFERSFIEDWLRRFPRHPLHGTPLTVNDLRESHTVQFWKLTSLKH